MLRKMIGAKFSWLFLVAFGLYFVFSRIDAFGRFHLAVHDYEKLGLGNAIFSIEILLIGVAVLYIFMSRRMTADIEERQRADAELRESEARFRAVFDNSPHSMYLLDPDGRFLLANKEFHRRFGLSADAVPGKTARNFAPPEIASQCHEANREVMESGKPYQGTVRQSYPDGTTRTNLMVKFPVPDVDGRPARIGTINTDITEVERTQAALRDSEARFRAVFELAAVGVGLADLDSRFMRVNRRFAEILGYGVDELIGMTVRDITHEDFHVGDYERSRQVMAGEIDRYSSEKQYIRNDGGIIWGRVTVSLMRDADGGALHFIAVLDDITERRETEAALRESEERYRRLVEVSPDGVMVHTDGVVTFANPAMADILGVGDVAALIGRKAIDFVPEANRATVLERRREAARSPTPERRFRETVNRRPDGSLVPVERVAATISWQGKPAFLVVTRDITERKQAQQALTDNEAQLRLITDAVPALINYVDRDRRVRFANKAFLDWFGISRDRAIGMDIRTVRGAAKYDADLASIEAVFNGERVSYEGTREIAGDLRHYIATHIPHFGQGDEVIGYFALILDVTEMRASERARRETEEQLRGVVENSPATIFLKDLAGRFVMVNKRFEEWYGFSSDYAFGKTSHDLFPAQEADLYVAQDREVVESGATSEREADVPFADGTIHSIRITKFPVLTPDGTAIGVGTINTDVTDQRMAEEQLRQAQKMEAMGQLTGGVAHDFNNLLTVILGNLELLESRANGDASTVRFTKTALRAVKRGSDLTQRLLAFSRRQPLSPTPTDANRLVGGMTELLHHALGGAIDLETVQATGLWRAMVDPAQLESAVLNLALNARDAMPEGGKLTIETANRRFDRDDARAHPDISPGRYVMIAVSDTGTGIAADDIEHVFEPFFTTKDEGRGSGLGLSMVFGFVKQSGGHLKLFSEPGRGTTARIFLPRTTGETVDEVETDRAVAAGRGETILVVEDDRDVREYVVTVLSDNGYSVIEAGDGPTALAKLDESPMVAMLLTDIILPGGMNGRVIAEEAYKRRPDLKILFTSGYADNAVVHHGRLDEGVELLAKPYTQTALTERVRSVLGDAG